MAAREITIIHDTSDTFDLPPLRETFSSSDTDLSVHSTKTVDNMGSQPSAYMFHNAAKMTHQLQIGDDRPEPLRVASSPYNPSPAHQNALHDPDFAGDLSFAAKSNTLNDENLSIEELIDCVCEIDVDDKHESDARDDQDSALQRPEQQQASPSLSRNADIDMTDGTNTVEYVEYEYEQKATRRAPSVRRGKRLPTLT